MDPRSHRRLDRFERADGSEIGRVMIMGIFELEGDKIVEWRDYFGVTAVQKFSAGWHGSLRTMVLSAEIVVSALNRALPLPRSGFVHWPQFRHLISPAWPLLSAARLNR